MKVKEVAITATIAWSDASQERILLAAGTDAEQFDATFSTRSVLNVYGFDPVSPDVQMPVVASVETSERFHSLVWSQASAQLPGGLLIGGTASGSIGLWNAATMLKPNGSDPLACTMTHHSGPVRALDSNRFQANLLASGASDGEVFVWDLNNPNVHLTPGPKTNPADNVSSVAWNGCVQHILASTSLSGRTVVWDLRANKAVITCNDSSSNIKCKSVVWHPDDATQLATGSEDDQRPVVQLWDLRRAHSPVKELRGHSKGILGLDWCSRDASMLLSCAKDNRVICWDPVTDDAGQEIVRELPAAGNWVFDVKWCPRDPGVIATASFDGTVSVYSLMANDANPAANSSLPVQTAAPTQQQLSHAPKWLKRTSGGVFGFGGRLACFSSSDRSVKLKTMPTDPTLGERGEALAAAMAANSLEALEDYAQYQTSGTGGKPWQFLHASLKSTPRRAFLSLLGHAQSRIETQVTTRTGVSPSLLTSRTASSALARSSGDNLTSLAHVFSPDNTETERLLEQALIVGKFDAAAALCIDQDRFADALIIAIASGPQLVQAVQRAYLDRSTSSATALLQVINRKNWSELVSRAAPAHWEQTLATLLTYASSAELPDLCNALGRRLETEERGRFREEAAVCFICAGNVEGLFLSCRDRPHAAGGPQLGLQDGIETAMFLRHTMAINGQSPPQSPAFGASMVHYAALLSSEGLLDVASALLHSAGDDVEGCDIGERLSRALQSQPLELSEGIVPVPVPQPVQPVQPAAAAAAPGPAYGNGHAQAPPQAYPQAQQAPASRAAAPGFPGQAYGQVQAQPAPPSSPHIYRPAAAGVAAGGPPSPMHQPQRTSQPAVSSPMSRQATMSRQSTGPPPTTQQPPPPQHQTPPAQMPMQAPPVSTPNTMPPAVAQPAYQQPPAAQAQFQPQPQQQPQYPGYGASPGMAQQPMAQASGGYGAAQSAGMPGQQHAPPQAPMGPLMGTGGNMGTAPQRASQPRYRKKEADRRWNDPPPLVVKKKAAVMSKPAAITNPLRRMSGSMPPTAQAGYGQAPQMYSPQAQGQGQAAMHPQAQAQAQGYQQQQQQQQQQAPPPSNEPPMPAEYQPMVDSLAYMHQTCVAQNNPTFKKKLEDVAKRLESLYSKLRYQQVDDHVVQGLMYLSQCLQQRDYPTAMQYHTQLVQTGNPDQTGSFLNGVKLLITISQRMGC